MNFAGTTPPNQAVYALTADVWDFEFAIERCLVSCIIGFCALLLLHGEFDLAYASLLAPCMLLSRAAAY